MESKTIQDIDEEEEEEESCEPTVKSSFSREKQHQILQDLTTKASKEQDPTIKEEI